MPKGLGIIAAMTSALLLGLTPAAADNVSEDVVKATFVYRFASFVEWPSHAFSSRDAPLQVCVFGASTMQKILRDVVREQTANGRPFAVRALSGVTDAENCHIVYSAAPLTADAIREVQRLPVLVITDAAHGPGGRGMIHFVVVDHRVRFHIDEVSADAGGLTISSRLLALALSVRRRARS